VTSTRLLARSAAARLHAHFLRRPQSGPAQKVELELAGTTSTSMTQEQEQQETALRALASLGFVGLGIGL